MGNWDAALPLLFPGASTPVFQPAPREYNGNMCGIRVPGLPPVPGGYAPDLFLSWFLDRYSPADRERIYAAYRYDDLLLSWPDSRGFGHTAVQFGDLCREVIAHGKRPAVMLASKVYDPQDDAAGIIRNIEPVIPCLVNVVPRVGIAWEANSFMSGAVLRTVIDAIAPQFVGYGCKVYVHFTPGVAAWQLPGQTTADFWNAHVGQLTGLFHQRIPHTTPAQYQTMLSGCLDDVLVRFAGQDGFSPDSGFGHPWDLIALEITASEQSAEGMSEAEGNRWGDIALQTPPRVGPLGPVRVMGSGNGQS